MKLEDRYPNTSTSVSEFNFEAFVETNVFAPDSKEDDHRDFHYADQILRPRHIVELHECIKRVHQGDNLFSVNAPVFYFDDAQLLVRTIALDSFADLLHAIETIATANKHTFLHSVQRASVVDTQTFQNKTRFKLRFAEI